MAELTFRDFAGAIMKGDEPAASSVLQQLIGVGPAVAATATHHFRTQMTGGDPSFLQKAMGLRTAVTTGSDAEIASLLTECFGLTPADATTATVELRKQYPAA